MEDLLILFDAVQNKSPLNVLEQETVLVQNPGMQHWLNMQQAQISGISMNANFVLPAQFLWKQLKILAGSQAPEQSPYSREVLTWRIDELLQSGAILNDANCRLANEYWQSGGDKDPLKRFQLATQLADLYEQYLIYRPEWINAWSNGKTVAELDNSNKETQQWQSAIWYLLNQSIPYDPQTLIDLAKKNIESKKDLLPKRVSLFGINSMAPMWVEFLDMLADVVDVHIYHLNPCYEYWGDIKTDKAQAKQAYMAQVERWPVELDNQGVNPLLANLGQQGREFLSQLHSIENIEIPLYDNLIEDSGAAEYTLLDKIQQDILTLNDQREQPETELNDSSITITSAHSSLREVQGLHDYLLHLFNEDKTLTPKDVLVMCPQIEDYAPYIDSVFVRGWDDVGESVPPLPCSIADRVSKDSEPLVAAFSELLSMPDSRFSLSQIMSYLRLLPLQMRFGLNEQQVELICDWLVKANIHWGLDDEHKNQQLGINNASSQFTWQQGLDRLLLGFVYGDQQALDGDTLYLPWVEGDNSIVLGKLILLIKQLQILTIEFAKEKSAKDWQKSLFQFVEQLFSEQESDQGYSIITHAIESLGEYCQQADYGRDIGIEIVRDFLNSHFSQPDPGRQFLIGQITFCSMLPMRSIPFKVIAVLGLNDGQYPRQRQPLGFDLMSSVKPKVGDRSRRADDRYLFLEALISARQNLYLSYQGRDIKNNNERQPSIVLRELMDYLQHGYNWTFESVDESSTQFRQLPLQVFSRQNYVSTQAFASFDKNWFKLANIEELDAETEEKGSTDVLPELATAPQNDSPNDALVISISQLSQFYNHSLKVYAEQRLKLFLNKQQLSLDDSEPFATNHLDKYLFQQHSVESILSNSDNYDATQAKTIARISGDFPDSPLIAETIDAWQNNMSMFSAQIKSHMKQLGLSIHEPRFYQYLTSDSDSNSSVEVSGQLDVYINQAALSGEHKSINESNVIIVKRPAKAKSKDFITLMVQHLCAQASLCDEQKVESYGYFFDEKEQCLQVISLANVDNAKALLNTLIQTYQLGLERPTLIHSDITFDQCWKKNKFRDSEYEPKELAKLWQGNDFVPGLGDDGYISYFYPQGASVHDCNQVIDSVFRELFAIVAFETIDLDESLLEESMLGINANLVGESNE